MLVKYWMSSNVITIDEDVSMMKASRLMKQHGIQHLPVMRKGRLAGIVSDRDLKEAHPSKASTPDIHVLYYGIFFMSNDQNEPSTTSSLKPVTLDTFIRAETDSYFRRYAEQFDGFGKINHYRSLVPIDKQGVIRMNRDTLYSYGIFDLMSPVTIHKPEPAGRFQSMIVINQDHYVKLVSHEAGS